MSKLLQHLVRVSRCLPQVPRPASLSLVSRVSSLNIAPAAHNALTSSRLCARLSHVTVPGTNVLSRWCHNNVESEKEIYNGILSTQIKLVKTFSLTTSFIGMAVQPVLWTYSTANAAVVVGAGAFLGFFTFVTPLLIHSFAKKYVTKLYYNQVEDKYTAVVYNFFLKPKRVEFKIKDVVVPEIPGPFCTFKANSVPLFVEGSQFTDIRHYGKIMGYDKPVDLLWDHEMNMTKSEAERIRAENKEN